MTDRSAPAPDILAALLTSCARDPAAPALSLGARSLSYGEFRARIFAVASGLAERGFVPGDRVLFSVRPGIDGICLALGIVAAGGTVVFADPGAGESLFRARATLAAPRWVAAESLLYLASSGPLRRAARSRGLELPPYSSVVPDARHLYAGPWLPGVPRGGVAVRALLARASGRSAAEPSPLGSPTDPALIIFTSGTTDHPKAVVHSRASLGAGLTDFASHVRLKPGDRVLTDQLMVGIPALIAGAQWMLPPVGANPGAQPEQYLNLLPDADVLFAVPAALDAILSLLELHPEKTPHIHTLLIGGAPVLRPLLERVRRRMPRTRILAIYGMTEILPVAIADGDEKLAFAGAGDYVGELMGCVTATIVAGELVLAGPGLALGYLGDPPLDELRTGDLARIEDDRVVLSGRSKDMFIRGTTNVYPGLYEPLIASLPGIADVAMVGVPDAIGDDTVVLVVVPVDGARELSQGHPVIPAIRRVLPGLIDAAVLPDVILVTGSLPRAGRSSKVDRAALAHTVAEFLA